MQTPSSYQQPVPPVYQNFPAHPLTRRESARTLALGMLNVVFGYVYLILAVSILIAASGYEMGFGEIAQLLGMSWAGIGLFVGGIMLLRGNSSGFGLVKSVFGVLLVGYIISLISTLGQVDSRYIGAVMGYFVGQMFLFLFFPLIVNYVARKAEDDL